MRPGWRFFMLRETSCVHPIYSSASISLFVVETAHEPTHSIRDLHHEGMTLQQTAAPRVPTKPLLLPPPPPLPLPLFLLLLLLLSPPQRLLDVRLCRCCGHHRKGLEVGLLQLRLLAQLVLLQPHRQVDRATRRNRGRTRRLNTPPGRAVGQLLCGFVLFAGHDNNNNNAVQRGEGKGEGEGQSASNDATRWGQGVVVCGTRWQGSQQRREVLPVMW